jgi:short-subunit dehydrogenase
MAVSLKDKHVLITGASRGLGRTLAYKFHAEGARVSLLARSLETLEEIKRELGSRVVIYAADLCNRKDTEEAVRYFEYRQGHVQVLINNAGGAAYGPFDEAKADTLDYTMQVNFNAVVHLTRSLVGKMKEHRSGMILNIASDLARRPLANMATYSAAKHAIAGFSQSLTRELAPHNVRVMLLNPGLIDSYFGGRKQGDIVPPNALATEDIADIVLFMLTRPAYVIMDEVTLHPAKQEGF